MPDTIATAEKVVLHVGCGRWRPNSLHPDYQKPEWKELRLDINPDANPDIVASMTDMSAVESGSVDAVWTSHSLEHLYAHEVPVALAEFHRVLRPGGHVFLRVPNLHKTLNLILQIGLDGVAYTSAIGPITPRDMLFGHSASIARGELTMQHKTGFTGESMSTLLREAGFADVRYVEHQLDLWARGLKVGQRTTLKS